LRSILTHDPWQKRLPSEGVRLAGAEVGGRVDFTAANFAGSLELSGLTFKGPAYFSQMRVGNFLDLSQSTFERGLFLNGSRIDGNVFLRDVHADGIEAIGAKIAGGLYLRGSKIKALNAQGTSITQDVVLAGATIDMLNLTATRIDGSLRAGPWERAAPHFDTVALPLAQVGRVLFEGARIDKPLNAAYATVKQSFEVVGGRIGGLNLGAATVKGDLILCSDSDPQLGELNELSWGECGRGTLDNSSIGSLQIVGGEWPPTLSLAGMTFRRIRNGGPSSQRAAAHCATGRGVKSYDEWFDRARGHFSPDPYVQVASVFTQHGEERSARYTLYRKEFDEWMLQGRGCLAGSASWGPRFDDCRWFVEGTFLWAFIGFGYELWRIAIPIAVMLGAGTCVIYFSGQAAAHHLGFGFWYSFDLLLPLVRLNESHYTLRMTPAVTRYFYFHRIMGYVLGTFLIAGIQHLAK